MEQHNPILATEGRERGGLRRIRTRRLILRPTRPTTTPTWKSNRRTWGPKDDKRYFSNEAYKEKQRGVNQDGQVRGLTGSDNKKENSNQPSEEEGGIDWYPRRGEMSEWKVKNKTRTAEWQERRGGQVSRCGKVQRPVFGKDDPYKKPVYGEKTACYRTRHLASYSKKRGGGK